MNIAIINTTDNDFKKKHFDNNDINVINTKTLNIKHCIGCFGCWTKTPGLCVQKDDMPIVLQTVMNSDLTVYVSDVKVGFVSAELKKINDKSIPLVHPYFEIVHEELHHKARYDRYPELALVLIEKDQKINDLVFDVIQNWFTRLSHNMKTTVRFVTKDDSLLGGLKNEISSY